MSGMFHGQVGLGGGANNHIKSIQTRSGNKVIFNDDEGSIFIEDPSGNTYLMDGKGNITVNAPNDITFTAGKNIKMNAGNDITSVAGSNIVSTAIVFVIINNCIGVDRKFTAFDFDGNCERICHCGSFGSCVGLSYGRS